ncbi:MAG: glycosyltransferase family 1 protein [Candidatus Woykebacteria bacterium]
MKIVIDSRLYGPGGTGIGKYTENLIENLQKIDRDNKYYILLRKNNWYLFDVKTRNFEKVMVDAPFYSLKEQTIIPAVLMKIKPDLVHFTHFNVPLLYSGKFVVTIHDLTPKEFTGQKSTTRLLPIYFLKRAGYRITLGQTIRKAKKVIVPSLFVKKKLLENFSTAKGKTTVIYEGVDEYPLKETSGKIPAGKVKHILAKYGIKTPFILYVGSTHPHKNLDTLVQAMGYLEKKYRLVLVGERNIFLERVLKIAKAVGIEDRIITTGFVPNEELPVLYKNAQAFVFPSLSEGFGLPGLEAMAAGCPVLASDIAVFKEVYGDAAVYFNPKKSEDIAKNISLLTNNSKLSSDFVRKGFDQSKKYSWRQMAEATLGIYKSL